MARLSPLNVSNSRISPKFLYTALLLFLLAEPLAAQQSRWMHGNRYVKLDAVAARLGMNIRWTEPKEEVELFSEWTKMRFRLHRRDFTLNGNKVALGNPIALSGGQLYISELDYEKALQPLLTPQVFAAHCPKLYHIVIDPGHGGNDPGAENLGIGVNEKTTVLDVAKRMQRKLEVLGYKVTLTRTTDTFLSLGSRPEAANKLGADLFISLHFNAVDSSKVSGVETYAMTPAMQPSSNQANLSPSAKRVYPGNKNDPWNILAAYYMQDEMVDQLRAHDRGVKHARFAVLRNLECPGVLIEGGFVTHPLEGRKIATATYREALADALVAGILRYQKTLNRVRGR